MKKLTCLLIFCSLFLLSGTSLYAQDEPIVLDPTELGLDANPFEGLDTGAMEKGLMAASAGTMVISLVLGLLMIVCMWKIYTKAGKPGWASIVPIYNIIVLLEIVGRPLWWIILLFIPFVNIVVIIIILIDLAKAFGKGAGFGIGLLLLQIIFFPILAFGSAKYVGPVAGAPATGAPAA